MRPFPQRAVERFEGDVRRLFFPVVLPLSLPFRGPNGGNGRKALKESDEGVNVSWEILYSQRYRQDLPITSKDFMRILRSLQGLLGLV
jgi:hypothetical protein